MIAESSLRNHPNTSAPRGTIAGTIGQALPTAVTAGLSSRDMLLVNATRPSFRTLEVGESLYLQGYECRNIYLLLDGWAFRHQSLEDGRRQILDFELPGSVFGLAAASVATHGVETLTRCRFSVFARDSLYALLRQVPVLALRFVELLAETEARAFEHLTSVGRRSARERVANLVIELLMRARQVHAGDQTTGMTLPLTQSHIADALGLASETVCRTLAAMRRDGIIVLRTQKLEVLDSDRLAAEAGLGLDRASLPAPVVRRETGVRMLGGRPREPFGADGALLGTGRCGWAA